MGNILVSALFMLLSLSACTDARWGKVYNDWFVLAVFIRIAMIPMTGMYGLISSLLCIAIVFATGLIQILPGGDIKLISVLFLFVYWKYAILIFVLSQILVIAAIPLRNKIFQNTEFLPVLFKSGKSIPLAPFVLLSLLITYVFCM